MVSMLSTLVKDRQDYLDKTELDVDSYFIRAYWKEVRRLESAIVQVWQWECELEVIVTH